MGLEKLDPLLKLVPNIRRAEMPLSFRQKMKWTALILSTYLLMFSIPALGVNQALITTSPEFQLISIVFAARIGSLATVGIGPIVLASIFLQLLVGSKIINLDLSDNEQKGRFQSLQKLFAAGIAIVEAYVFVATGYVPIISSSLAGLVVLQLAISAIFIIFLDEAMTKYGITSGINLFIAAGVSFALIAGTIQILLPAAVNAITRGGATAIPDSLLAFGPLFFAILVMLISIYAYDIKVELPLAFSQFRGVGGRLPIPFLYVSVLPVILAMSLELSFTVWFRPLAGVTGNFMGLARFIAYYQPVATGTGGTTLNLVGGLVYLISPTFPLPYPAPYGGGYPAYIAFFESTSPLYLPFGGVIQVPELVHVVVYVLVLLILCVIFGRFWIEMTGQNPKAVADQLQSIGWQIPGFRRDPRIVESLLKKYIMTVTVLGSLFVGLLAAFATLTGAVGSGMGILLLVGIMYMIYQQIEQDRSLESMPRINKMLS
ncbi:MAG: hypothetical protein QXM58_00500 [Candidatus Micrarchaeaceae archaeon]